MAETGIQLKKETSAVHQIKIRAVDSEKTMVFAHTAKLEDNWEASDDVANAIAPCRHIKLLVSMKWKEGAAGSIFLNYCFWYRTSSLRPLLRVRVHYTQQLETLRQFHGHLFQVEPGVGT